MRRTKEVNRGPSRRSSASIVHVSVLAVASLSSGGCAVVPGSTGDAAVVTPSTVEAPLDRVAALELSAAATQLFDAPLTTVQVPRTEDDPFVNAVVDRLQASGFGIRLVTADQGTNLLVRLDAEPSLSGDPSEGALFRGIGIGAIEIGRDYEIGEGDAVRTAGPLRVSGSRRSIDLSAGVEGGAELADPAHAQTNYASSSGLEEVASPIISLVTPEVVQQAADVSAGGTSLQGLNASRVEVNNLFYGDPSNFGNVLDDYDRVLRRVVVFGDDSLVLGENNQRMLADLTRNLVRPRDLVSLVGCSNGPTRLEIGNEGLALGRAERVMTELVSLGLPDERILDEGCWGPTPKSESFPGRGVVLELYRPKV